MNNFNLFVRATLPRELLQKFNQHIRDFDVAHADCHFEVMMDHDPLPDMSLADMIEEIQVTPGLKYTQIFERKK